jgi:hypothetical protein
MSENYLYGAILSYWLGWLALAIGLVTSIRRGYMGPILLGVAYLLIFQLPYRILPDAEVKPGFEGWNVKAIYWAHGFSLIALVVTVVVGALFVWLLLGDRYQLGPWSRARVPALSPGATAAPGTPAPGSLMPGAPQKRLAYWVGALLVVAFIASVIFWYMGTKLPKTAITKLGNTGERYQKEKGLNLEVRVNPFHIRLPAELLGLPEMTDNVKKWKVAALDRYKELGGKGDLEIDKLVAVRLISADHRRFESVIVVFDGTLTVKETVIKCGSPVEEKTVYELKGQGITLLFDALEQKSIDLAEEINSSLQSELSAQGTPPSADPSADPSKTLPGTSKRASDFPAGLAPPLSGGTVKKK